MNKLIISAAITGGITSRQKNPNLPYTSDEIAQAAYDCWNAGASIVHIHARENDGSPSYRPELYEEIVHKIRTKCNIIISLSTSGLHLPADMTEDARWAYLKYNPELASFSPGSVNHGDKVFINSPDFSKRLAFQFKKYNVKPEIEIFHEGMINEALTLAKDDDISTPFYFQFVLGVYGGITATCKNLLHLIDSIPEKNTWSAAAIGRNQLPINLHTILLGGHVRTGFEDNVYYQYRELAKSNAQLVERLAKYSLDFGRGVASPEDARKILNLI